MLGGVGGYWGVLGVFRMYFASEAAQFELRCGRVLVPAASSSPTTASPISSTSDDPKLLRLPLLLLRLRRTCIDHGRPSNEYLTAGSLGTRTSTRPRSEHDLPSG